MLSDVDKERVRELCENAEDGPWYITGITDDGLSIVSDGRASGMHPFAAEIFEAEFCAESRMLIPKLLAEVERLEGVIENLNALVGEPAPGWTPTKTTTGGYDDRPTA